MIRATQHALDDLNEFSAHHLRLTLGATFHQSNLTATDEQGLPVEKEAVAGIFNEQQEVALTVRLTPRDGTALVFVELEPHSTVLDVFYGPNQISSTSSSSSALADAIASKLRDLYAEEQASIAYTLMTNQPTSNGHYSLPGNGQAGSSTNSSPREQRSGLSRTLPPELAAQLARRTTRSLKYAPTYHITISLFSPTADPSAWDIESAVHEYLAPLLELFSISNFTVDTQVQLHAAFSPSVQEPEYDSARAVWTLRTEDLGGFINAAEWPLGPSVGEGPTLNFIVYVPDRKVAPLVVQESQANSWLIPQWGGVVILNSATTGINESSGLSFLTKEALQPALLIFSHQLLSLLGAPQSPSSFPLQLQTLTRVRAASLLLSASSTMGSLARLTVALPSIAIPESVALAVDKTLSHLRGTCSSLRDGRFDDALEHARVAEAEAEKGFFEKSMVGQVYFPDEHKVAVYLPLLGPIGVPLIMSAVKEIKRLRAR